MEPEHFQFCQIENLKNHLVHQVLNYCLCSIEKRIFNFRNSFLKVCLIIPVDFMKFDQIRDFYSSRRYYFSMFIILGEKHFLIYYNHIKFILYLSELIRNLLEILIMMDMCFEISCQFLYHLVLFLKKVFDLLCLNLLNVLSKPVILFKFKISYFRKIRFIVLFFTIFMAKLTIVSKFSFGSKWKNYFKRCAIRYGFILSFPETVTFGYFTFWKID